MHLPVLAGHTCWDLIAQLIMNWFTIEFDIKDVVNVHIPFVVWFKLLGKTYKMSLAQLDTALVVLDGEDTFCGYCADVTRWLYIVNLLEILIFNFGLGYLRELTL